jgi:peptide/nickel transport system substrate-binding protein
MKNGLLLGMCMLVLVLFVSGCVETSSEPLPEQSGTSALKIAAPSAVKSPSVFGDSNLGVFFHLSNPPLMKMDEDGRLVGQLVERYEVTENNTVWTFFVKDDLYWSDGTKVTPEDLRFSIEYTGKNVPSAGWINDTLVESSATDSTFTLRFCKPYTRINLEFATYNIIPKHIWSSVENPMEYTSTGPYVGCGPYYLETVDINAGKMIFTRNPYWKGSEPAFQNIEVHWFATDDVATLALEKGEVDAYYKYAGSYPYANLQRLENTGRFDFVKKMNMGLLFLGLNLKEAPTSDLQFREALASAIDYDEIVMLDTLGYGMVPSRGFVPPSMEDYKETASLSHDPARARQILDDAGYRDTDGNGIREGKDGKDIELEILIRDEYSRVGELLGEYLSDVGIGATIKTVDKSTWFTLKDEYAYDLTVTRTTPWGMLMHANWGTGYFDARRTGQGVLHIVDDPVFLALCDNILSTTDPTLLRQYAGEVQDYYAVNLPAIPLYWNEVVTPFNKNYVGWHADPLYGIYNLDTFTDVRATA